MKSITTQAAAVAATLLLSLTAAQAGDWSGNVSGMLGQKSLDDKDWPDADKQSSIGMLLDFKRTDWPVSIAIDLMGTGDENKHGADKDEAYTAEMNIGLRKIFTVDGTSLRPYVGGGFASIYAESKSSTGGTTTTYDDTASGGWVGAGAYYDLTPKFHLGLDARYSRAEVRLNGEDREAGGTNLAVSAGYHW
ncbi:MAG: hypothetical protein D6758_07255 [Gammaproteobacteria bacterium]|nr:MAG: hypothetical protein D6758_07255 [Gammaproteobacteria bacterium]